jgi:hypothetical protein
MSSPKFGNLWYIPKLYAPKQGFSNCGPRAVYEEKASQQLYQALNE